MGEVMGCDKIVWKETYTCTACNRSYSTREEAEGCFEEDNTCPCIAQEVTLVATTEHHTDRYCDVYFYHVLFDWKNKCVFERIVKSGSKRVRERKDRCAISFCPFCGRKL